MPAWAGWALLGLSVVGFVLHGWDKWRATRNGRRVPETVLHIVELLGGWPGALIARHWFRHKTVKLSYRITFWLCVLTNAAVVGGVLWFGDSFGEKVASLPE
ncbi:hypothetical protein LzC2_15660 [Planctomycetes bacterium LzC2]|uniref:DUF1294 domain-containing protein n=1 Tax=Alienimonas chondri TaxID=2681879 RepID=A0ABX1VC17_9PLAN|nr:hypothetical protein [Alienimonas chondri]